jgi:hypothetical protein
MFEPIRKETRRGFRKQVFVMWLTIGKHVGEASQSGDPQTGKPTMVEAYLGKYLFLGLLKFEHEVLKLFEMKEILFAREVAC